MATVTPRATNESLHPTIGAARLTLGNRILLSFGVLFVLMLVTAGVSYERLRAINSEAVSIERDSLPGVSHRRCAVRSTNRSCCCSRRRSSKPIPTACIAISRKSPMR